jgi:hypothetical protein
MMSRNNKNHLTAVAKTGWTLLGLAFAYETMVIDGFIKLGQTDMI